MAVTENTYTGNGSTTLYSFTFPYLDEDDIKVSLNGVATTAYTLANATTVSFNAAPANGAAIRIYRETDDTEAYSTFFPGSAIRAQDLNQNFLQSLYLGQESTNESNTASSVAASAVTTANTALTTANNAVTSANSAVSTANTASTNASAAVVTANTASTNASAAVSTANAASTAATTATSTAISATSTANTALSTANTALSTANTAATNASAAVTTANTASTNASNAVSTANTASTNASNAVTTANTASTNASNAVTTANAADGKANQAIAAVASAILYTVVANVAAIPGSPANNTAIEVTDSTGIQSFTPLAGVPGGFTGSSGLSVRIVYSTSGSTWNWIQYFPNDPESRYLKQAGGTMTGQLKGDDSASPSTPGFAFDGDPDTGIGRSGANELNLITGGNIRLSIDGAGNISANSNLISSVDDPVSAQDAATKNYVDTALAGISADKISEGNSSVEVVDTGSGEIVFTADGSQISKITASGGYRATGSDVTRLSSNVMVSQLNSTGVTLGVYGGTNNAELRFLGNTVSDWVGFKGPTGLTGNVIFTLPSSAGSNGQVLATDGSSLLSWSHRKVADSAGNVQFTGGQELRIKNGSYLVFEASGTTNYVRFGAPSTIASNITWTLPNADGSSGQALKTNGSGTLSWGPAGGASGGGTDQVFYENDQTVTTNYTISTNKNAMTAGPVTINSGVTVVVPNNSSWVIV